MGTGIKPNEDVSITSHLLVPFAIFIIVVSVFEIFQLDLYIADWLYRAEGFSWSLKNSYWLEDILHRGARSLVVLAACLLLLFIVIDRYIKKNVSFDPKIYLFISVIVSVLIVSLLKKVTHVGCPWHYERYGGDDIYVRIFEHLPSFYPQLACFPGGHASAGYAWVALYYYFLFCNPKYRWLGLGAGLFLGLTFDITQQLRGAHFVSHGLWTVGIAWLVASGLYFFYFKRSAK